ncbi:hypothetical protein LL033_11875 [Clostridium estertheticum]|uniref:hypothetical protein n=1 Tax=Clostridium estertheticum TaxID=238834 RepID=UPI001C0D3E63|nr:hypothetical protein [Clostridium estertheticum]MBU3215850.1 hypothetical protein [Clostridium estertheticum]WAG57805.1 hypothetical protein LL033_11875 [Clostridium estertheticum]
MAKEINKHSIISKNLMNSYEFDVRTRTVGVHDIIKLDSKGKMMVDKTMKLFKDTMLSFGTVINEQQEEFAFRTAKLIFGQLQNGKINLVSAKCGFGKSVLIQCAMKILVDNLTNGFSTHHNEGAIIVTDKIKKLEDFKLFVDGTLENKKGHRVYLLQYTPQKEYETDEEYYATIYAQRKEQANYPIVLISSQRLSMLNEKIDIFNVWNDKEKEEHDRTIKIIDEKPEIFDMMNVDNNFFAIIIDAINHAKVIDKVKDVENKNYLLTEIQNIVTNITELSNKMAINGKQIDIYSAVEGATLTTNDTKFFDMCDKYLNKFINSRIGYLVKLWIDEGGIFCNSTDKKGTNIRYFRTLGLKQINTGIKTIIFDATSHYDMSYLDEDIYQYIDIDDERDYNNLDIHNIPVNMAKWAITEDSCKKLKVCADYLKSRFSNCKDLFLVTYKDVKYILDKQLNNELNLVKLDDNIPSFGATKGKNNWNQCTNMIHLGFNRMREVEYISRYLSIMLYGQNVEFFKGMIEFPQDKKSLVESFELVKGDFRNKNIQKYMISSLLVDFEQEIFRTKIREFTDTTTPVHIYVFNMYEDMIGRVETRFKIKIVQETEPIEFMVDTIKTRKTKDGKETNPQKILSWIDNTWNGEEIKCKSMLLEIGLTSKQFNKAKEHNTKLVEILSTYMISKSTYKKVI